MGKVASLLSESLINGFTTGAAIHVLVSQLKDLVGVKVQRYKGLFQIVNVSKTSLNHNHNDSYNRMFGLQTIVDVGKQLPNSNINTVIISLSIVVFMMIMNELVKVSVPLSIINLLKNTFFYR